MVSPIVLLTGRGNQNLTHINKYLKTTNVQMLVLTKLAIAPTTVVFYPLIESHFKDIYMRKLYEPALYAVTLIPKITEIT